MAEGRKPPRTPRAAAGQAAEDAAAHFLESQHCTILTRNYRCRSGELDIVAEAPDGVVLIAEVRLRASNRYGGSAASVDWRKQRRIGRATGHLLARHPALARRALRFDVLALQPDPAGGYLVEWIRHAFEVGQR
ncbi:MAG: YraN family protein [Steroidobacteraceae bacterium]